jgi:transposase
MQVGNNLIQIGCNIYILQSTNDPKHRSKIAKKWKEENSIEILSWLLISPDQNPIENVWRLMKINI